MCKMCFLPFLLLQVFLELGFFYMFIWNRHSKHLTGHMILVHIKYIELILFLYCHEVQK